MDKKRVIGAMKQTMSVFWEEFGASIMFLLVGLASLAVCVFVTTMGIYYPTATLLVVGVLCVLGIGYCFTRATIKNYRNNNSK